MVFTGEASWRWRMQLPSSDRSYDMFWRQSARWIATGAPDAVSASVPLVDGGAIAVSVDVRSDEFAPVADGTVAVRVTHPDGHVEEAAGTADSPHPGRYVAKLRLDAPGIYRVTASARRGADEIGAHERWVLVGGTDLEMADPRLNDAVLRRVATASGGAYVGAADASTLPDLLAAGAPAPAAPRLEELWHTGWVFAAVIALLGAEWGLRRRWGLR